MASKYDVSTDQAFIILDNPQPCSGCGQASLTLFIEGDKKVCARCVKRSIRPVRILT
jgi:hypothetical protein